MDSNKSREYYARLGTIFNSDAGKEVLQCWMEEYVYPTAVGQSAEATYYNLGISEFVLTLHKFANEFDSIKNIDADGRYISQESNGGDDY